MGPISTTRLWLERVVIGLSLCPWAAPVHERSGVRIVSTSASSTEDLCASLWKEIRTLSDDVNSGRPTETTIMVAPHAFPDDFLSFNDFMGDAEALLQQEELDEDFQLVAFHPHFRFAGEDPDDASNYVNRSPHPAVHILTQDSVTAAVEKQPSLAGQTPLNNQRLCRELGVRKLSGMLESVRAGDDDSTQDDVS